MRILLIEDEEKVARFVKIGLKAEHYAVDHAMDVPTALSCTLATAYDLVIVDLTLPKQSGTQFIKKFRETNKSTSILVLTARDAVDEKVANFEAGADDYLTKPFAFAELLVRIKALLRRGSVDRSNFITIADLEINRMTHLVKRNGIKIKLTSKEYSLLEYLAINAARVLSRTMIVEHVWDQSFEGFTNIVDVYIRQLRVKIDDQFDQKLIHTFRNIGYSLSEDKE